MYLESISYRTILGNNCSVSRKYVVTVNIENICLKVYLVTHLFTVYLEDTCLQYS